MNSQDSMPPAEVTKPTEINPKNVILKHKTRTSKLQNSNSEYVQRP